MRFGIDLGGTKTEIVALDRDGAVRLRRRRPTPPDYAGIVESIAALVAEAEVETGAAARSASAFPAASARPPASCATPIRRR